MNARGGALGRVRRVSGENGHVHGGGMEDPDGERRSAVYPVRTQHVEGIGMLGAKKSFDFGLERIAGYFGGAHIVFRFIGHRGPAWSRGDSCTAPSYRMGDRAAIRS